MFCFRLCRVGYRKNEDSEKTAAWAKAHPASVLARSANMFSVSFGQVQSPSMRFFLVEHLNPKAFGHAGLSGVHPRNFFREDLRS
uniref:Uncharacterized protein n=1 Tax=Candidatus Kentrum sp. LFY TaxID=2126342 RepID=A0A450WGD1_9GAMM|nr:MAG: hypothetical protein BECKLFY1418C_GA0070996_102018 [Candidatus Kentron sp. LFY]